jgi:hypothetical protein
MVLFAPGHTGHLCIIRENRGGKTGFCQSGSNLSVFALAAQRARLQAARAVAQPACISNRLLL